MKKGFLLVIAIASLTAFSNTAMADWTQFPIDKSGERVYVEKDGRIMSDNIVSVKFLTEFDESLSAKASNGERYVRVEYISKVQYVELDCSQEKFKIMQTYYFQLPMAKGKGYKSPNIQSEWLPITRKPLFGKKQTNIYWQQKLNAGCDCQEN